MTAYRIFPKNCEQNRDTSTWRFDFVFIDNNDIPKLLVCLTEKKADTKVQIYYYNASSMNYRGKLF